MEGDVVSVAELAGVAYRAELQFWVGMPAVLYSYNYESVQNCSFLSALMCNSRNKPFPPRGLNKDKAGGLLACE